MKHRVINIGAAEEFDLIDPVENKTYTGIINMQCLSIFQEMFNFVCSGKERNESCMLATIIYSAINAQGEQEIEFQKAQTIAKRMSTKSAKEIIEIFSEGMYDSLDEKQTQIAKKVIAQHVLKMKE